MREGKLKELKRKRACLDDEIRRLEEEIYMMEELPKQREKIGKCYRHKAGRLDYEFEWYVYVYIMDISTVKGHFEVMEITGEDAPSKEIIIGQLQPFDFTKNCEEISKAGFIEGITPALGEIARNIMLMGGIKNEKNFS